MTLEYLLTQSEGKTLEFKRDLSSPDNILKTIVAFANTSGGTLLIGIENETKVIQGVKNTLNEEERLANLIADNILPKLVPNIEIVDWKNVPVIKVEVYPGSSLPYYLRKMGPEAGVFIRLGSTNRAAGPIIIQELKRTAQGITFDETPLPEYGDSVIDVHMASQLFDGKRKLGKNELKTLRVLTEHQKKLVPTVGGMLLFGKIKDEVFSDAFIQCARFRGTDKSAKIVDHREIHGPLPLMVDQAVAFFQKHAFLEADIKHIRREDRWSLPMSALREAVVNAIAHADYAQKGMPIKIAIYDDRIEIDNPGFFINGITLEDIWVGVSKLRNKVIGRVFKELGLIEQWGTGLRKIKNACEVYGFASPIIEELGGPSIRLTIFTIPGAKDVILSEKDKKMLSLLEGNHRLAVKDIASKLKLSTRAVRSRLNQLIQRGFITSIARNPHDPHKKFALKR